MSTQPQSPLSRITTSVHRLAVRRRTIVSLTLLCALLSAGWFAKDLGVSQDFRRLLPQDSESIARLLEVDASIGNQSDLYLVIEGDGKETILPVGESLEAQLGTWEEFRFVLFHRDVSYFENNALLFASIRDRLELHDRVEERIRAEVAESMALGSPPVTENKDDWGTPETEDSARKSPKPYMSTNNETLFVLIARPVFPNTDVERSRALYAKLESTIQREMEKAKAGDLKITIQGSFAEQSRRQDELDASIVKGSLLAFIILFFNLKNKMFKLI